MRECQTASWLTVFEQWSEDIIRERDDGSSDGLPEDKMIENGDSRECLWWNPDLQIAWEIEDILPERKELSAEELVNLFNKIIDKLYHGKQKLTPAESNRAYKIMTELLVKKWYNIN